MPTNDCNFCSASNRLFFLLCIALSSCAALGTKTTYKETGTFRFEKIGFTRLENDTALNRVFKNTSKIFASTLVQTSNSFGIVECKDLAIDSSFDNPNSEEVSSLCGSYQLDGVILTRLRFVHVRYSVYFIPVAQNYDTEVEMKLLDKHGKLVVSTTHNTLHGNSYMMPPSADKTVRDGTRGAAKRIFKEIGLVVKKKSTT